MTSYIYAKLPLHKMDIHNTYARQICKQAVKYTKWLFAQDGYTYINKGCKQHGH